MNDHAYFVKTKAQDILSEEDPLEELGLELIDPETEYEETFEDDVSSGSDDEKSYMQSPEPDDNTSKFCISFK